VGACQLGGAPELAVRTYPGVPLFGSHEGISEFDDIKTPFAEAGIWPTTFAVELNNILFKAVVEGYVAVL